MRGLSSRLRKNCLFSRSSSFSLIEIIIIRNQYKIRDSNYIVERVDCHLEDVIWRETFP